MNGMRITCDPVKDASNREKHGLSLGDAVHLDWDRLVSMPDNRRDYGELREVGYGLIADRLHCVVFVRQGSGLRIISFRRANRREVLRYVSLSHCSNANA